MSPTRANSGDAAAGASGSADLATTNRKRSRSPGASRQMSETFRRAQARVLPPSASRLSRAGVSA